MRYLMILVIILIPFLGYSSHCVGGDITYRYTGTPNTYEITLSFYRDCLGIPAPGVATIEYQSATYGYFTKTLGEVPNTGKDVSSYCTGVKTTCTSGFYTGVQKWQYRGNIILQGKASDWVFYYELCCRNASISDLFDPGNTSFYVYSYLDNTNGDIDSPVFLNDPVPFICAQVPYCFNSEASTTLDSLQYIQVYPLQINIQNVVYLIPYTYLQPITSNGTLTFDNTTGVLCFTPQGQEIDVLAILVKGYKDGVLVSKVQRDIQITITTCPCDPLPVELVSFEGYPEPNRTVLTWSTVSEINNHHFIIESSLNGSYWVNEGNVPGSNNTTQVRTYQLSDNTPMFPGSYYRLSQVDYDGKLSILGIIKVLNPFALRSSSKYNYNIIGQLTNPEEDNNYGTLSK